MTEHNLVDNPFCKWPVNLSCWCGSGLKFKKCCANVIPAKIPSEKYQRLKTDFDRILKHVTKLKKGGYVYFDNETSAFMKGDKK